MSDPSTIVDTHLEAYCEPDVARRGELIAKAWAPDGQLIDPPIDAAGHAGISDLVGAVLGHYPGHRFRRTTGVDTHHDALRYGWELVAPDGSVVLAGMDVGQLGADGRLERVTGFFGDLPAKDA
jgi:hypothetical protein